jgi:AhpD family alkylhydroperoxidase
MSQLKAVEYSTASPEVKAVYDDIKQTRQVDDVNNFWKYIAQHPPTLARTWDSLKDVMAPGALDPLIKELLYVAVSVTNNCGYCVASHTAAARRAGMTDEMFGYCPKELSHSSARCSANLRRWSVWRTRPTASRSDIACRSTLPSSNVVE